MFHPQGSTAVHLGTSKRHDHMPSLRCPSVGTVKVWQQEFPYPECHAAQIRRDFPGYFIKMYMPEITSARLDRSDPIH